MVALLQPLTWCAAESGPRASLGIELPAAFEVLISLKRY